MVDNELEGLSLFTVVLDGDGRAAADLTGDLLFVVLALAEPLAELGAVFHFNERDVVGLAKGMDKLLVLGVLAVLSEDAQERFLPIQRLRDFVQSLHEAYEFRSQRIRKRPYHR